MRLLCVFTLAAAVLTFTAMSYAAGSTFTVPANVSWD